MRVEICSVLKPAAGEVVIDILAAGVNPVDTYIRSGAQGYAPKLPYTPGLDGAGVVQSVGEGVSRYAAGDRVYCFGSLTGTYAGQARCLETQVYPLPEAFSFAQGAALGVPYGTAYRALFIRGCARPGDVVLVHGGSGGVGLAAIQLARAAGMKVYATAGTEEGRSLASSSGALAVGDHHAAGHLDDLLQGNQLQGFDVILEMLANVNLDIDLPCLALGGRVVVIGNRGRVEINPRDLMQRDASVVGMSLMHAKPDELARIHAALFAGLQTGALNPVVACELPLDKAPEAHRMIMEQPAHGKIVLVP
jgi:NADPH2:quinone reductase